MKKYSFLLAILSFFFASQLANASETNKNNVETDYYGADLTKFPPDVRSWIMTTAFSKEKMNKDWMVNSKLKVFWSKDENAVLAEASYTVANGYKGAGTISTWGQNTKYGGGNISSIYGKYAKYHTMKFKWEHKQASDKLIKNDKAYAEVVEFCKKLCDEIEYDWRIYGTSYSKIKRTPNKRYLVCDGYSNEIMDKVLDLKSVETVQKWSSDSHSWNVLKLVDGRTLYLDLTWFDNEYLNDKSTAVKQLDDYNWANLTFEESVFRYSGVGFGDRRFHHDIGKLVDEKRR